MAEETKQPFASSKSLVNAARSGLEGIASKYMQKYSVGTTTYPSDLFTNTGIYGDNYVVFYINVPEQSKLVSEGRVSITNRDTVELGSAVKMLSAQTAEKLGDITGEGLAGIVKSSTKQTKRILDTITMNIPNNLTTRYSMNYQEEDMALATAAAQVGGDMAKALSDSIKSGSLSAGAKGAGEAAGGATAAGAGIALAKLPMGGFASAVTGLAQNPKKEQLFKGVDFRVFNFEYQFAPRNEQESKNVKRIIDLFKLHMHPEFKDDNGYLFIYPSEFEIVYYQGDSENMNLPRHTSSVLVDMSINYTPQGMYNTFNDGASTLITMNLTFKELAILTKAEMLDGF